MICQVSNAYLLLDAIEATEPQDLSIIVRLATRVNVRHVQRWGLALANLKLISRDENGGDVLN